MTNPNPVIVELGISTEHELAPLGLSEAIVRKIAEAVAGSKAEALPIDPLSAPGTLAYIQGIRGIRRALLPKGWRMNRKGNVESTINDELGIQLLFQNVDRACSSSDPQAISKKGTASRKLVEDGQGELFGTTSANKNYSSPAEKIGSKPVVWMLCVSSDDRGLQAEVSCPKIFDGEQFDGFHKRIFVINDKYDPEVSEHNISYAPDAPSEDFEIKIVKK